MSDILNLGRIRTDYLEREFGKLLTDRVIVTEERILHIQSQHPLDFELFRQYGFETVQFPDLVLKDPKNQNTVLMFKRLESTNLNVVVKLLLQDEHPDLKNSVMTFYRVRNKNLEKLRNKCKLLYEKE